MRNKNDSPGLFQGIMLAHLILLLHLLLIGGIGFLIIFFRGIVSYFPLIFLGVITLGGGSAYYLFKRLKSEGKSLRELLNSPSLAGKSLEIRLLGGVASIKIDPANDDRSLPSPSPEGNLPLPEDQHATRRRELIELARTLENKRNDPVELERAKRKLSTWKN
jgi:hypothetical protein